MKEITKLKNELSAEWNKPKKKNMKDGKITRDSEKVKSLIKQINEEKAVIRNAIAEKEKIARKKEVENNNNRTKFLVERDKILSNIAKVRRQKRKQKNGK